VSRRRDRRFRLVAVEFVVFALAGNDGDGGQHLVGQLRAVGLAERCGGDPDHDLVAIDLLERDVRLGAHRRLDDLVQQGLEVTGLDVRAQPRTQVDRRRLPQRHDRGREHHVVRDHDRVLALGERRVEQAERRHDALDLAGDATGLQAHAVADLERTRRDQHHARDQVAERLLGRETEDHGGDRATDGQRLGLQARRAQREQRRRRQEHQPDQEPDCAGRGRVHAPEQRRSGESPKVARQRPAQHHYHERRPDTHGRVGAEQLLAPQVAVERDREQRHEDDQLAPGTARVLGRLQGQAARPAGRVGDVRSA
jgi:hypothetical protein